MAEKKLVIKPHRFGEETAVISLRLPKEMLAVIDQVATDTGRTRKEILVLSMEFVLENMETNEPLCGKYAEGKTGFFTRKKIQCSCGNIIDVRTDKLAARECPHCGTRSFLIRPKERMLYALSAKVK